MVSTMQEAALLNPARDLRVSLRDAVQSAAEARLRRSAYPEVGRVRCEFRGGIVTLWGRVSSYFLKQVAQALVFGMDGVVGVDNQLEVVPKQSTKSQIRNPK
jgi:osmotically-inducible protein OsmY